MNNYIGIPMGDPAGVGPEIVVKALSDKKVYDWCKPVIIGDKNILEMAMKICKLDLDIRCISDPKEGHYKPGILNLIDLKNIDIEKFEHGKVNSMCGQAAFEYIEVVCDLAMKEEILAIATTPINKESFKAAGVPYIGHTEALESLTGSSDPLTMFQVYD